MNDETDPVLPSPEPSDDEPPSSWKRQIRNRIETVEDLRPFIDLTGDEERFFTETPGCKLSVTPYYMGLVANDPTGSLRRCTIPTFHENIVDPRTESQDSLDEEHYRHGCVIHRYPDRALFLSTSFCSVYCRYCTRSRMISCHGTTTGKDSIDEGLDYIRNTPSISDVIVSGGDPLTLDDGILESILSRLRDIPHVKMIRIGTKVPAVLPMRITDNLVQMLRKYRPLWINIHFTHPAELTDGCRDACMRLSDAGIPLFSQTVLLKGVNDDPKILSKLFKRLLEFNVKPYYIYHCDSVVGTSHFRTTIKRGLEIMGELQGSISGYAIPQYIYDIPGGGGKVPLVSTQWSIEEDKFTVRNFEGRTFRCEI